MSRLSVTDEIEKIDLEIKNLTSKRSELLSRFQAACRHPDNEREAYGYMYDDGYGGAAGQTWYGTGWGCKVCGFTHKK